MVQFYLLPVIACICFQSTGALRETSNRRISMLTDNNGKSRKKVINPNDIANVFNKKDGKAQKVQLQYVEETNNNLYNDEDEEEEEEMRDSTRESLLDKSTVNPILVAELNKLDKDIQIDMNQDDDLRARLESKIKSEADIFNNQEQESTADVEQSNSSSSAINDDEICYDDEYLNLSNLVDQNSRKDLSNTMSIMNGGRRGSISRSNNADEDVYSIQNSPPRVFQYDPSEKIKIDPMVFGAYRRSKLPPSPPDSQKSGNTKLKSGRKNSNKDNKNNNQQTTDSFYDQIKKFGSGPGAKGGSASTGVAEPPPGMRNITPKKAPTSKNRRKIVTPEEINSLFVKNTKQQKQQESNDMNQQNDENDNEENPLSFSPGRKNRNSSKKEEAGVGSMSGFMDGIKNSLSSVYNQAAVTSNIEIMDNDKDSNINQYDDNDDVNEEDENMDDNDKLNAKKRQSSTSSISISKSNKKSFNPVIGDEEKFPKWLIDAEKEKIKAEKERLAVAKGKRKKKLTDDWRFWAAIITTIGFGTAFYSIYQQTGGFDTDISAFNFGMPTTGGSGFTSSPPGSDELII